MLSLLVFWVHHLPRRSLLKEASTAEPDLQRCEFRKLLLVVNEEDCLKSEYMITCEGTANACMFVEMLNFADRRWLAGFPNIQLHRYQNLSIATGHT